MALTDAQKTQVVIYLGWPAKTLTTDSTHYSPTVAARLTGLSAEAETQVTSMLTKLAAVATKYEASTGRMLVKKVGDIELNTDEHATLSKEYVRLQRMLSAMLDIPFLGKSVNVGVVS